MHQYLQILQTNYQHWLIIALSWLLGGGAVWLTTQAAKSYKQWEKDSTIQKFAYLASLVGTAADWYVKNYPSNFTHATNPVWFLPVSAGLFTIATFIHHTPIRKVSLAVSSAVTNKISPYFAAVKVLKAETTPTVSPQTPAAPSSDFLGE